MSNTIYKLIASACFFFTLIAVSLALYQYSKSPKIAFADSSIILRDFNGMKEAQALYKEKSAEWQADIDSENKLFEASYIKYTSSKGGMRPQDTLSEFMLLEERYKSLMSLKNKYEEKAKEEDKQMTAGVLNKINSFVEKYGQERGYDLILGATNNGSVLYGDKALDISKELVDAMNVYYAK